MNYSLVSHVEEALATVHGKVGTMMDIIMIKDHQPSLAR